MKNAIKLALTSAVFIFAAGAKSNDHFDAKHKEHLGLASEGAAKLKVLGGLASTCLMATNVSPEAGKQECDKYERNRDDLKRDYDEMCVDLAIRTSEVEVEIEQANIKDEKYYKEILNNVPNIYCESHNMNKMFIKSVDKMLSIQKNLK